MPELPDLLYIRNELRKHVLHRTVTAVQLRQPVVLRSTLRDPLERALHSLSLTAIDVRGPFLLFTFSATIQLVVNLMLAGRIQHQRKPDRALGYICIALRLDDGTRLNICDEQKMVKVYLVHLGVFDAVPQLTTLGIDVLSPAFTTETFRTCAARHARKQVRSFLNDHTILNSIGNAYADEILFEAAIHPKTLVASLDPTELDRLHAAILTVLRDGSAHVEAARQPVHVKVRDHMRVRNRKGEPCPRCGTTIRREGVRGYDVFFCPHCQPARRAGFIDWQRAPGPDGHHDAGHS